MLFHFICFAWIFLLLLKLELFYSDFICFYSLLNPEKELEKGIKTQPEPTFPIFGPTPKPGLGSGVSSFSSHPGPTWPVPLCPPCACGQWLEPRSDRSGLSEQHGLRTGLPPSLRPRRCSAVLTRTSMLQGDAPCTHAHMSHRTLSAGLHPPPPFPDSCATASMAPPSSIACPSAPRGPPPSLFLNVSPAIAVAPPFAPFPTW